MCHPYVYTINQDNNGYLWLGTGEGLCRYDGFEFVKISVHDSLAQGYVNTSYKDNEGNLWFGHYDGNISFYNGQEFFVIEKAEQVISTINDICSDKDGNILAVSQNEGLIFINKDLEFQLYQEEFQNKLLYSVEVTEENKILIGRSDGLYLYSNPLSDGELSLISRISGIPMTRIQCITKNQDDKIFRIGTEDEGFYEIYTTDGDPGTFEVINPSENLQMKYENVQSIFEDKESNLWISTFGSGVFKLIPSGARGEYLLEANYTRANGLGSTFIKNVFQDYEDNIWVGTYGNGLASLVDQAFTFFRFDQETFGQNILSVFIQDNIYWFGGEHGLMKMETGLNNKTIIYNTKNGLPDDYITALNLDSTGIMWIGTERSGIYKMDIDNEIITSFHVSPQNLENSIKLIDRRGDMLWAATKNGILSFSLVNGQFNRFGTNEGLPHNNINHIFFDNLGKLWFSTTSNGIRVLNEDTHKTIPGNYKLEFIGITEDPEGNFWAATSGDGVFKFTEDSSLFNFIAADGLKNNYCYSIIADEMGDVWVGHRLGISRINTLDNTIKAYSLNMGITGDCNSNSAFKDNKGNLWFGTTDGVIKFDFSKEKISSSPPQTNLTSVKISDNDVDFTKEISLPYGAYKFRVDFIGIYLKEPEQVSYQYKLNGWDENWTFTTSLYANYSRLTDGNYTFLLRSCNSDGLCDDTPLEIQLTIKHPFWETWWFISGSIVMVLIAVVVIVKIRERKQKQLQEYLETELNLRTKEVVEQKEEIEIKNKDITDSINYAQRIQASILPPLKRLHDLFNNSFIFYRPRDIVSGDFYWYDMISDEKFVIVCADSTGHGVPGAFMSMIGTTLLKDICMRPGVDSPSDILNLLDEEIHSTLNQNIEAERSNDGMDIIVCEINIKTDYFRFASAMRPVILYQNGEQVYVKGSRSSIGGEVEEDKYFENQGFQLTKGDKIYMFSDGYPDQFGGPLGKKFKMVRLKNLLSDIYDKPMAEQHTFVKNNFDLWKDSFEQVDDVLFMGIQI